MGQSGLSTALRSNAACGQIAGILPRHRWYARLRCVPSKKSTVKRSPRANLKVSLKFLADYLELSPATVSLVMNRSAVADSIPQATKERIFAAASKLNYRPH